MLDVIEIEHTVQQIATMLRANGCDSQARAFERSVAQLRSDPNGFRSDVLGMYGGAGSFNDLVLHKDGKPLVAENNALDALRERLWTLIHPAPAGNDDGVGR